MTPDRLRQIESVSEQHSKMTIPKAEDWIPYHTDPDGIWEAGMLAGSLGMVPIVRELLDHIHALASRLEPWIPTTSCFPMNFPRKRRWRSGRILFAEFREQSRLDSRKK